MKVNVQKALGGVNTTDGTGGDFIPTDLAAQLIEYVKWNSVGRNLWDQIIMPTPTFNIPKLTGVNSIYYVGEGSQPTQSGMTTDQVTLTAKKLMGLLTVDSEIDEDSKIALLPLIKTDFGTEIGLAETDAFFNGDTGFAVSDHPRKAFNGLRALAAGTAVDAAGSRITLRHLNQGLVNLGRYGQNPQLIDFFGAPVTIAELRKLYADFDKYTIFNSGALKTGQVGAIWGMNAYSVGLLPTDLTYGGSTGNGYTESLLVHRRTPIIGDRRAIKFKTFDQIWTDQLLIVPSERIAFNVRWTAAIVKITNLEATLSA
jgi:HK97 family phage major capsid protein